MSLRRCLADEGGAHIRLVLPHGADPVAEDVVVADGRALIYWPAKVHVQPPKLLHLRAKVVTRPHQSTLRSRAKRLRGKEQESPAGTADRGCCAQGEGVVLIRLVCDLFEVAEGPRELQGVTLILHRELRLERNPVCAALCAVTHKSQHQARCAMRKKWVGRK